jgi:pantetheine-phosphate adenylyltransferase
MMRIAVFAGSFDPVTVGHADIVARACKLFDKVIVAIGVNTSKKTLFTLEQRKDWLRKCLAKMPVEVDSFEGLTVDFCRRVGATYLVRGLRGTPDFEYEKTIAQLNAALAGIETVFLATRPEHSHISSTIVREILINKGDASAFLPKEVAAEIRI